MDKSSLFVSSYLYKINIYMCNKWVNAHNYIDSYVCSKMITCNVCMYITDKCIVFYKLKVIHD